MRRARLNPKTRTIPSKASRAAGKVKLARAAQQIRTRQMPIQAALMLRRPYEIRTFDPASNGVTLNVTSDAAVAVSASGYVTANSSAVVLNQIPQGTSSITRLGRRILMKSILLNGAVFASNTVQATTVVRVALVYLPSMDRTVTTMPPQNVIWTAQNALALRQITDNMDFKIVRQWFFTIGGDRDAATTGQEFHHINELVPLNLETVWSQANTNGTFDDMDKGALCLYVHSSAVNANPLQAQLNARIYFEE